MGRIQLDDLSPSGKRHFMVASMIVGITLSHVTMIGRVYAKLATIGKLQRDDWFMLGALLGSYGVIGCNFYGLNHGLGLHEDDVPKSELKLMNLSIWIIQRFQPPTIFCLKTSILLLYVRIFNTPKFRKVAWGIGIYTFVWAIEAWFASLFECWPVQYFWDKSIKGGHCIPNPLTNVGFSNGFISFVGDLFILCMPMPMIWRLQMNRNTKIALTCIFLLGIFVVGTSIIRLIALFTINTKDVSFTQVQAGVWTYLEMGIGITCGNLPLLRPLFRRLFDKSKNGSKPTGSMLNPASKYGRNTKYAAGSRAPMSRNEGFERMGNDVESFGETGSEVELREEQRYRGKGIEVKTDVELSVMKIESDPDSLHDGRDPLRVGMSRGNIVANRNE